MKQLVFCVLMWASSIISMEQIHQEQKKRTIAKAMAHQAERKYYDALIALDALNHKNVSKDDKVLLKKLATKKKYIPLLDYAFGQKKILPHEEIASCLLIEAALADSSNLEWLLSYKVNPNTPGKLLFNFGDEKARLFTPLVAAIEYTKVTNINALLEADADVNACLPHENLPLMEAIRMFYLNQCMCQRMREPQADHLMHCQTILTLIKQKKPNPLKDNGKEVEVIVQDNITIKCRNAWEMACQLGYEGLAKGFEQSLGPEEFSKRFEELYSKGSANTSC